MDAPFIMVAPNGAYKTKQDHATLPVSIAETVNTAMACHQAGAHGLHAHVRDSEGKHCLDAGLYLELIQELSRVAPNLLVQITTEAVGKFTPQQQRDVVNAVNPQAVSIAVKEMMGDDNLPEIQSFYHDLAERQIDVQHILYSDDEVLWLDTLIQDGIIPPALNSTLFVLGRYSDGQLSSPSDLLPFLAAKEQASSLNDARYMVCAFGPREIDCLLFAAKAGADCRIGFENNLYSSEQQIASSNEERVLALHQALQGI